MSLDQSAPPGGTPRTGGFDFGLTPTSQLSTASGPSRRTRRRSGPDRSVVVTVAAVIALAAALLLGAGFTALSMVNAAEQQVRDDSAPFCAELATTPGVLEQPGFGWPTEPADLPTSIGAMRAYADRWEALADLAHPTIRAEVRAIATAAATIASGVEASQTINRPAALTSINQVTTQTAVPAWVAKYCG